VVSFAIRLKERTLAFVGGVLRRIELAVCYKCPRNSGRSSRNTRAKKNVRWSRQNESPGKNFASLFEAQQNPSCSCYRFRW